MRTAELKFLTFMQSGEAITAERITLEGTYPVFGGNGLRGFTEQKTHSLEAPLVGRQGALCGNVNYATGDFYASEHAIVAAPRAGVNPRWLYWMLQTLDLNQYSMAAAQPGLSVEVLERIKVVWPEVPLQQRIANFLDQRTARVDALIAEKKHLLERLHEYEQAETSRLVRTGLRGGTLMATGREVLPEAPKGWRVTAFKRAISAIEQGWSPQCESRQAEASEWGVLKVGCVNGNVFNANENKALPPALEPDLACVLQKGDVLMSRANTRELVGMAALVHSEYPNLLLCDKLYRLKLRTGWLLADYSVLLLRSDYVRRQIELGASGASASMQNISQDVVRELIVAIPSVDEQHEIVEAAVRVRVACETLASHVTEHIERLREYRASLIAAAVIGQLDVGAPAEPERLAA